MKIYPAIDLREGRCVRLLEGDYERETRYQADPVSLAKDYEQAGAEIIHVVDLDGARDGAFTNLSVIESMASAVSIPLQCGGGIRREADLLSLFNAGVGRAVIGSLAVQEPEWVKTWLRTHGPDALTLALDCRQSGSDYLLAISGWTRTGSVTVEQGLATFSDAGLRHVLCTDIGRDGTLSGPNVELYRDLVEAFPDLHVQASGGVSGLDDLGQLLGTGVAGVVVGKALLDGRFSLEEGLSCSRAA
jgi:phosphoribosylformimino-5-aminoimidazole carboxamide ribotide isomerase